MKRVSTQSTLLTCLVLSASAAFVSSCQDYEPYNDQHLQDVAYTHEFERQIGKIDPNQNWDLFGQLARKKNIGTRAPSADEITVTNLDSNADAVQVTRQDNLEYQKVLPEGAGGSIWQNPDLQYEDTNLGRVVQDFVATAHEFTIAPVHWTTSGNDVVGIYWYTDDESEATETIMGADGELYWIVTKPIITGKSRLQYYGYERERWGQPYNLGIHTIDPGQNDCSYVFNYPYNAQYLISHPVRVQVPEEIPYYGFYLQQNTKQYSEAKLNTHISNFGDKQPCYVATFNIQRDIDADYPDDRDYLCFEDWFNNGDFDLNDLVFRVEGFDEQAIIDQTTVNENAILVCEDLKEFDFDFNDIAIELNYTEEIDRQYQFNEHTTKYEIVKVDTIQSLKVTALAAGGAYESTVTINNQVWGEIHALLNESPVPTDSKKHKIINASGTYTDLHGESMLFTKAQLPEKNVGVGEGQYPTYLSQLFDTEGFFKIVSREDGEAVKIISNDSFKGKGQGTAPQMMLLPDYFEWPQEQKYIVEAYTGFSEWVQDVTKTNWILDSQVEDLITDRGDLTPTTSPEVPTEVTETIDLDPKRGTFTYTDAQGNHTYNNGIFLDLSSIQDDAYDGATAKLHITYTSRPSERIWIDDAFGREILSHNTAATDDVTVVTYTISANKLRNALESNGIWIVSRYDNQVNISAASIDISNVTTEAHHKLFVNPLYMTFETMEPQTITASSSTHGIITFTSSDNSVATVDKNTGKVTPVAEGYCSIVVRAEESTVDGKLYKSTSERVSIEVITGDENRVVLVLGPTQNIAGTTETINNYALCTTARDVMKDWNNGATLTVTKTAGNAASFRIKNESGTVVGTTQTTNDKATFTLTKAQLDLCENSDGSGYTFRIEHTDNTYIQSAILYKR
ncbi:MAG: Ig-like domain-containing protein [Bacteroidales bacterium]|nr:Ig-like domain-containing protein [Bacteroidales bacterium]